MRGEIGFSVDQTKNTGEAMREVLRKVGATNVILHEVTEKPDDISKKVLDYLEGDLSATQIYKGLLDVYVSGTAIVKTSGICKINSMERAIHSVVNFIHANINEMKYDVPVFLKGVSEVIQLCHHAVAFHACYTDQTIPTEFRVFIRNPDYVNNAFHWKQYSNGYTKLRPGRG